MSSPEKRRGRWWRWGLVLLVSLAVLGVAAAMVVPRLIPWDRVKAQAEQKLSEVLKHRVTIGQVGFKVLRGFEIRDLRVENAAGFSKEPLFTDDLVSVQYRLLPLLLGQVVLKSIRFEKPRLLVERGQDGRLNFADMLPAPKPEAEPTTPAARALPANLPLELLVSDFTVAQAEFIYRDLAPRRQEYRISSLDLEVTNLTLAGLTPVTVDAKAVIYALDQKYPVSVKLVWRFAYRQGRLHLDQADVRFPGVAMTAAGTLEQALSSPQVHLSGKVNLDWAAAQKALPSAFSAKLPDDLHLLGTSTLTFNINGPTEPWTALAADVTQDTQVTVERGSLSLPLSLKGTTGLDAGRLELKLTLQGAGTQGKLILNLDDLPARRLLDASWSGTVDLAGTQKFIRPGGPLPSGQVTLEARVRGSLADVERLDFSAELQAKGVGVRAGDKALLDQLEAQIRLSPKQVKISRLSGKVGGQSLTASLNAEGFDLRQPATLKPETTAARLQWSLSGKVLDVDALLALSSRPAAAATTPTAMAEAAEELPEPDARTFFPAKMEMTGHAKLEGLHFGKLTFGAMTLDQKLKHRELTLKGTMQGYKGEITHATTLDGGSPLIGYAISVKPERMDLEPMLNDLLDTFVAAKLKKPELLAQLKDKFVGRLTGSMDLKGRGLRQAQLRPNLTGKGRFELRDGRIRKFDFQDQLAGWFGSDKFRQDIPFERADLDFTLATERVTVTRFIAESGPTGEAGDIRLTANGPITFKADFRDFKLQPHLNPRASHNLSPELSRYAEVLKDDKGWVTIPARMNGPVAKPDVQPDLDWIKGQAGSYVQKKTQAAAQDAQQKVNKFVDQQQGKSTEEIKNDAAKELEKAKEQLQKLNLQNIFK
jgi:uncharacterized protein involved in outer membrane biogenesis